MANPSASDVHINVPLTNISIAEMQDQADRFIATSVFPQVQVEHQSDLYYVYDRDQWFRTDAEERADSAESVGTGYSLSTDTYYARIYALHRDISSRVRRNADAVINLDRDATRLVTNQLLIKRERIWQAAFFAPGIWTDLAGVASSPSTGQFLQWDQVGSKPIEDVQTALINMGELTSFMPNVLVMGPRVETVLLQHPEIIERVKYTAPGFLRRQVLATAFGVDKILVPNAVQNIAATEGATRVMQYMYGKNLLLAYAAPSPGLMTPSAGYTFAWTGVGELPGSGNGVGTDIAFSKWWIQERKADRIEGEMSFAQKVVASDLGTFFANAIS